jgi:aryl-alcohol dehydrogenase-like predicted oxidoreductase
MRRIADRTVHPVGLGAMPLSDARMVERRDQALATIHAALTAGVGLIDTADVYAPRAEDFGHNELLVGEAVRAWVGQDPSRRSELVVATKGGLTRRPGELWGRDARPDALLRAAEASAERLDLGQIDLYYLHRTDPAQSFRDQLRGLRAVRDAGIARTIGLSNVTEAQFDRALDVLGGPPDGGVVAVQNEFSPAFRAHPGVLRRCDERGVAFVPWSPFGGVSRGEVSPRFADFGDVGRAHRVSRQQVVLAWLLAQGQSVIPIPGASRPATIQDSAAAVHLRLSRAEIDRLDATGPTGRSVFPDDTPPPPW